MLAGEARSSIVAPVPSNALWSIIHPFTAIQHWAEPIVSDCFIENSMSEKEIGAIRCAVLREQTAGGTSLSTLSLREKLIAVEEKVDGTRAHAIYVSLPNPSAPFPHPLSNLTTTISVRSITATPQQSFVEISATFTASSPTAVAESVSFLEQMLFSPMLHCLVDFSLNTLYKLDQKKEDLFHRQLVEFEAFGDELFPCGTDESEIADRSETDEQNEQKRWERAGVVYHSLLASWLDISRRLQQLEALHKWAKNTTQTSCIVEGETKADQPVEECVPAQEEPTPPLRTSNMTTVIEKLNDIKVYSPDDLKNILPSVAESEFKVLAAMNDTSSERNGNITVSSGAVRRFWQYSGRYGPFSIAVFTSALEDLKLVRRTKAIDLICGFPTSENPSVGNNDLIQLELSDFICLLQNIGKRM